MQQLSEQSIKETVIVVHGTFAAPVPGQVAWYEPDGGEFCRKLDEALKVAGAKADKRPDAIAQTWKHDPDPALCDELNKAFVVSTNASDGDDWFAFLRGDSDSPSKKDEPPIRRWKPGDRLSFFWDGRNDWKSRQIAADLLRRHLQQLHNCGWRCHIVAHSHGGNVVLEAFKSEKSEMPEWFQGHIVLLGTPVIETARSADFGVPTSFWSHIIELTSKALRYLYMAPLVVVILYPIGKSGLLDLIRTLLGLMNDWRWWTAVGLVLLAGVIFGLKEIFTLGDFHLRLGPENRRTTYLVINLPSDEALRLLVGANKLYLRYLSFLKQRAAKPSFRSRMKGRLSSVWNAFRSSARKVRQDAEPIRTGSFLLMLGLFATTISAFCYNAIMNWADPRWVYASLATGVVLVPLSYLFHREFLRLYFGPWSAALIGANAARTIVSQIFLRKVGDNIAHWAYAQLLGINGAPFTPASTRVTSNPNSLDWCLYEHKMLDRLANARALSERSESAQQLIAFLNDILAIGEWTDDAVSEALKRLNLPSLVHTYYYQSDECIEEIAQWITRTNEEAEKKWRDFYPEEESLDFVLTLSPDERFGHEDRLSARRDPVRKKQLAEEF